MCSLCFRQQCGEAVLWRGVQGSMFMVFVSGNNVERLYLGGEGVTSSVQEVMCMLCLKQQYGEAV